MKGYTQAIDDCLRVLKRIYEQKHDGRYYNKEVKSGNVTAEFRAAFEKALEDAWQEYNNGARLVDQFEDDYTECAFAKGFLSGCIYRDKL